MAQLNTFMRQQNESEASVFQIHLLTATPSPLAAKLQNMYHWCLLIKKYSTNALTNYNDKLIASCEPETVNSISRKTYSKLFFLGLIEFLPTVLGIFATGYFGKILFSYDYIIVGIVISILLVKHLSKKAPELPFSLHH
jgi:hypothetical protein